GTRLRALPHNAIGRIRRRRIASGPRPAVANIACSHPSHWCRLAVAPHRRSLCSVAPFSTAPPASPPALSSHPTPSTAAAPCPSPLSPDTSPLPIPSPSPPPPLPP